MTETIVNLLVAFSLLAANAFYVAAEFALVKSRGFRINAMVEQNRFAARLLQQMLGNIEAYLACCQLGITMASLGLGWVGEPTVSALLEPVLVPFGMSESALHFTSFMVGFLLFSSLQQAFINLHSGRPGPLPPPREDTDGSLAAATTAPGSPLSKAVVGGPQTVRAGLEAFIARHGPDELIVTAQIFDQDRRIRSLEIAARARDALAPSS